jgi:hypothetical protein
MSQIQALNQPSQQIKRKLACRWKRYEPRLLVELKSLPISGEQVILLMERYQAIHQEALFRCLDLCISIPRIKLLELDDPSIPEDERETRIQKFLAARATHPGRPNRQLRRTSQDNQRAPIYPGDL